MVSGVAEASVALGTADLQTAWDSVRGALRQSIGARSFDHWLKPASLAGFRADDAAICIALPSDFMANWVRAHHGERLLLAWQRLVPSVRSVEVIAKAVSGVDSVAMPAAPIAKSETKDGPATVAMAFDPRLTFDRFVSGQGNAVAINAAKALCDRGNTVRGGHLSPLFIHAQTGQGKTHLLHAIGHEWQALRPGSRVVYMSAERFMFEFVAAVRAKDTFGFKARLRSSDLLMIDDVQFIAGKDSTQEEFLHTVDELMCAGRTLVISADRGPHALDGVEGRILSRLTQGLVIDIKPADFALRRAILDAKIAMLEGVTIANEVRDQLAARLATNIRELEGGLNRLVAYAGLGDRAVTVDFAEEVLADMFRAARRRITIDEIQKRVSEHFRIRQAEMVSARRAREVARPRQIAMYLAKQLTPRSLPEIGRRFGGRDHTTVIHACRQIEKLRGSDSEIDSDVRTLIRVLEG